MNKFELIGTHFLDKPSLDYNGETYEQSDNDDKVITKLKPWSQIVDLFYGIEKITCCCPNKVFYDKKFYAASEVNQKKLCKYCNYYQKYFIKLPKYLIMIFNEDISEIPKKIEKKRIKNQIASIKYFISHKIHKFLDYKLVSQIYEKPKENFKYQAYIFTSPNDGVLLFDNENVQKSNFQVSAKKCFFSIYEMDEKNFEFKVEEDFKANSM